jgi:hypothetical protein
MRKVSRYFIREVLEDFFRDCRFLMKSLSTIRRNYSISNGGEDV